MLRLRCSVVVALSIALTAAVPSLAEAQARGARAPAPPLRTDTIARVVRLRATSVVAVHTLTREAAAADDTPVLPASQSLGSGVVVDASGLILTNAHVVKGVDVLHIRTPEGDDLEAKIIGTDPDVDLALLRASDSRGLKPAPLGDSNRLQVGEWVVAIGNPLGLHHTVTAGILSAKARTLDDSGVEYLQTDAAISPGSSGGPLFDLSGRIVGINVGILSTSGQNVGLNLAIPVSVVKEVLPRLRRAESVNGWIGVATEPLSARGAAARGITRGLVLTAITKGGPAHRAGLRPGDVVIGFVDAPAIGLGDFYRHIRTCAPGSTIRLTVWRNHGQLTLPIEIGHRPIQDDPEPVATLR